MKTSIENIGREPCLLWFQAVFFFILVKVLTPYYIRDTRSRAIKHTNVYIEFGRTME